MLYRSYFVLNNGTFISDQVQSNAITWLHLFYQKVGYYSKYILCNDLETLFYRRNYQHLPIFGDLKLDTARISIAVFGVWRNYSAFSRLGNTIQIVDFGLFKVKIFYLPPVEYILLKLATKVATSNHNSPTSHPSLFEWVMAFIISPGTVCSIIGVSHSVTPNTS